MTEELLEADTGQLEEGTEIPEETEHLGADIIDEEWLDEDGLNTLFWSEPEPEPVQIEPETEVLEETEIIPPEIRVEPEPVDEVIEPEEVGV
jgi:hypothetical protein